MLKPLGSRPVLAGYIENRLKPSLSTKKSRRKPPSMPQKSIPYIPQQANNSNKSLRQKIYTTLKKLWVFLRQTGETLWDWLLNSISCGDGSDMAASLKWTRQQWQQEHFLDGSFSTAEYCIFLKHPNFSATMNACWRALEHGDRPTYITLLLCLNRNNLTFLQADLDLIVARPHINSAALRELYWFIVHGLSWQPITTFGEISHDEQVETLRLFLKKKLLLVHPDKFKGIPENKKKQADALELYGRQRIEKRVEALYGFVQSIRQITQNKRLMRRFFKYLEVYKTRAELPQNV